ncbi:AAA family ATPase [Streptomyces sp. NPDC006997]|uniref:AAA family ATPase n=1 Tax=Streptomyces sp. NPDC006997 TaxID=3155356 RepID=UPI0033D05062
MENNHSFADTHFSGGSDAAADKNFGRLTHYSIRGLFGSFNHTFHLERDEPTLLTGVNGTGKSTVLRTIEMVSLGNWAELTKIHFDKINLHFENADIEVLGGENSLTVRMGSKNSEGGEWTFADPKPIPDDDWWVVRNLITHRRLSDEAMEWAAKNLSHDLTDILHVPANQERPGWLNEIPDSFPALLISDRRLTANSRRIRAKKRGSGETTDVLSAIEAAFANIDDEVQRYRSLYATNSQKMDRDFPRRVLSAMRIRESEGEDRWSRAVHRDLMRLDKLQSGLSATGLVDAAEVEYPLSEMRMDTEAALPVISTYLKDTISKLATFEPLRERLEPFVAFLRRHYRNKEIGIQDEHLRVKSKLSGEEIPPTHLSSGEQQILILAHKVLFETAPGTLVMIDEPELSLHVLWQSTFIDDLTEMSAVTGCQFLLATHSPTLIAGRNDLRRSLDG